MAGTPSTTTRCAANAMACKPELQKRLIVVPAVVTGKPARIAARRATLWPVAPSGSAQPRITSSISAGSSPLRFTACSITWPPIVTPCVSLNAPRNALPIGVRAVETIAASRMRRHRLPFRRRTALPRTERAAAFRELSQQRRGRPVVAVRARERFHLVDDGFQPDPVSPAQRPAAERRERVAVHPHDVDVTGPRGNAFVEDLRRFVDQQVHAALEDLVVGDLAPLDAGLARVARDHLVDHGIGDRRAAAGLVAVEARARLLAETPHLAQLVADLRVAAFRRRDRVARAADAPADVEPGEVAHRERPHRKPEVADDAVDLLRRRTLFEQEARLARVLVQHADRKSTRLNSSHANISYAV